MEIMASRSNAILVAVEAGGRETVAVCAYQVRETDRWMRSTALIVPERGKDDPRRRNATSIQKREAVTFAWP